MAIPKPRLIIPDGQRSRLGSVSWEKRRRMTAAELIELMGPLHVQHPDFVQRSRSLLPLENIAGRQPVVSHCDYGLFGALKAFLLWVLR